MIDLKDVNKGFEDAIKALHKLHGDMPEKVAAIKDLDKNKAELLGEGMKRIDEILSDINKQTSRFK
jgi:hypothetical protein